MPIWKIEPIDPDDESWALFRYCGAVIVRAEDEAAARRVAAMGLTPMMVLGAIPTYTSSSPWQDEHLSTCRQIENSKYDEDGKDELLEPKGV
jgi:hypothetical protein